MSIEALLDESALVARAKAEPCAFADLYDHYFPRVYNYVRYRVRYAEPADDVTAQIFERALINIRKYSPDRGAFADWLFAIARNCVRDHIRGEKRARWVSLESLCEQPGDDPAPEEVVVRNETHERLRTAVAGLSNREQEIVSLKFAAGLTNRSIAGLCGLKEGHVAVILYRAVRRLRRRLYDPEEEL